MAETKYAGTFPDENVPASEKAKKAWNLAFAKAAYTSYRGLPQRAIGSQSAIRYGNTKKYALGQQSTEEIKKRVRRGKHNATENQRTDFRPWHIVPKFIGIATEICSKARDAYKLNIRAIDPCAQDEIADEMTTLKAKALLRQSHLAMGQHEVTQTALLKTKPGEPDDEEGCDLMAMGARHFTDAEMEDLVQGVLNANDYERLCKLWDEDLVDFGVAVAKDDTDGTFINLRRVNPERLIIPYSETLHDLPYAGELHDVPVSALVPMSSGELSKEEVEQIFKLSTQSGSIYTSSVPASISEFWSKGRVRVLDMEMITTDEIVRGERVNKRGNKIFSKIPDTAKKLDNGQVLRKHVKRLYRVKWVVGTDIIFHYGLAPNQKRDPLNKARTALTFHIATSKIYKMDAISRTEALIPFADAIQTAWFRLQNALNTVVPKGYEIDVSALEAVDLSAGGKAMTPLAIIDFFFETGILVSRSQGQIQPGQQRRAIVPLEGGVGTEIAEFWTLINNNIELMRQTLGINATTDASTPNAKLLNGVAELAAQGTNNALGDLFFAGRRLENSLGKAIVTRAQAIYRSEGKTVFAATYGTGAAKAMGNITDVSKYIYQVEIEDMPTAEEEAQFNQDLSDAVAAQQIGIDDRIMLRTIPNIRKRQAFLTYKVRKNAEKKQQEQITLQQTNSQVQMQAAQATEQAKQATIQVQLQADIQRIQVEKDLELRNQMSKDENMLKGKQIEGASRVEAYAMQADERAQRGILDNHTEIIKKGMDTAAHVHKTNRDADHALYEQTQEDGATETDATEPAESAPAQPTPQPLPVQEAQPQQQGFSFLPQS